MNETLSAYGWDEQWAEKAALYAAAGQSPGRVIVEHRGMYRVVTEQGECLAEVAGKLRHQALGRGDFPAVGDWVMLRREVDRAVIHALLPRRSSFSRQAAGNETSEQIVGANIDTVFLIHAVGHDFNVRRLERYLVVAWESGASPVIVLTKSDLAPDIEIVIAEAQSVAPGVPVHAVSNVSGSGLDALGPYFASGRTVALLGSSGVGKSTLTNRLLGRDAQAVQDVREDDERGRHTTTHREMFLLPEGGVLIDTPGMRELQLRSAGEDSPGGFEDIESLADLCRFRDCMHRKEPGCAIQQAIRDESLAEGRLRSYRKLQRELKRAAAKESGRLRLVEKQQRREMFSEQQKRYKGWQE